MKQTILVAGATGNLGSRIVKALLNKGATVRTIVRKNSDANKVQHLMEQGVNLVQVNDYIVEELTPICAGVDCVVSALQGLHNVIVDAQKALLDAAVAAKVPRFIPSDFAVDFVPLPAGENRNFDLRKEFHTYIEKAGIKAPSIYNGAFAEVLGYGTPLLNVDKRTIGYWEDENHKLDFTTMENTATYTAAAALDNAAPSALHIASFEVSAAELKAAAEKVFGTPFTLVRMGSLQELTETNKKMRAEQPEGEQQLYPRWQQSQYIQSQFSTTHPKLDNTRYDDIVWTGAEQFLEGLKR
jgi:nucleoside-diphosphate-sugar epimerase